MKAPASMYSTPSAMFTVVRAVQSLKAVAPTLVTVPSTSTVVIWSACAAQGAGVSLVKLVIRPVPLMVKVPSASAQVTPSPQLLLVAAAVEAATEEAAAEEAVVLEPPQPVRAMAAIRTAAAALHRRTLRSSFMVKFPLSYSWYTTFYSVCLVLCGFVRRSSTVAKKRL